MAKSSSNKKSSTRVTRITASDSASTTKRAATKPSKPDATRVTKLSVAPAVKPDSPNTDTGARPPRRNPLRAFGEYFAGAWYELRQVRWPNRSQTWQMTGALIAFTAFFVIIILLLDAAFNSMFNKILG